jgi:hypothetical protein
MAFVATDIGAPEGSAGNAQMQTWFVLPEMASAAFGDWTLARFTCMKLSWESGNSVCPRYAAQTKRCNVKWLASSFACDLWMMKPELDKLIEISPDNLALLLGIAAAGYAGTEAIEALTVQISGQAPMSVGSQEANMNSKGPTGTGDWAKRDPTRKGLRHAIYWPSRS